MNRIYTIYHSSPAGLIRISGDDEFISEVSFRDGELSHDKDRDNKEMPEHLLSCLEQLKEYFSGSRTQFCLPLRQPGTDFQQEVWKELLSIPYGSTISYWELSRRLGNVKAIRAAAATNGKNRIAIIVPCHRVVGSNQAMVGYAAGIPRKKWLLEHELKFTHGLQTLF